MANIHATLKIVCAIDKKKAFEAGLCLQCYKNKHLEMLQSKIGSFPSPRNRIIPMSLLRGRGTSMFVVNAFNCMNCVLIAF